MVVNLGCRSPMIVRLAPTLRLAIPSSVDGSAADSRVAAVANVVTRAIDPDHGSRHHAVLDDYPAVGVVV
jgi:hypothetical protein